MIKYVRNPVIKSKVIDDEQILLNTETGDYFGLNELGAEIWELVDGQHDLDAMIEHLLDVYEVEKTELTDDVTGFIDALLERSIIFEG